MVPSGNAPDGRASLLKCGTGLSEADGRTREPGVRALLCLQGQGQRTHRWGLTWPAGGPLCTPSCDTEPPCPLKVKWGTEWMRSSWQQKAGAQFQGRFSLQGHIPNSQTHHNHWLAPCTWGPASEAAQPNLPGDPKSCPTFSFLGHMDVSAKPSLAC